MYEQIPVIHTINYGDTIYNLAKLYNTTADAILNSNPYVNPYNLIVGQILSIFPNSMNNANSKKETTLSNNMRMFWEQHVFWTRLFIISLLGNLKDLDPTTNRLLRTAPDIANLFAPYYGNDVANTISKLLTEHLTIAADLVKAYKENNRANIDKYNRQWYDNANQIADALSSINPHYDRNILLKMLHTHLDLTKEEVAHRLSGNHVAEVNTFDKIEQQALEMADYFVKGIVNQFPDQF